MGQAAEETGLKGIALTPFLSKKWNALSDEEKEQYNAASRTEMVEYKKKMAEYKTTESYQEFQKLKTKKKKKKSKKPKDKNAPKRPSSAYFLFMQENREEFKKENPTAGIAQLGKIAGQKWRELSEVEKSSFVSQALKLREAYQIKLAEYKKSDEFAAYQEQLKTKGWKYAKN